MKFLLDNWLQSFLLLSPLTCKSFLKISLRRFYSTSKTLLSRFGFLLAIDVILFVFFGPIIFKTFAPKAPSITQNVSIIPLVIIWVIEINWVVFSSFMLLLTRKKGITEPLTYLKQAFFNYLQLLFFFCIAFLFVMTLFVSLGITKIPHVPWIFIACYSIITHFTIFYWLDCPMSVKDIFLSVEKAINCFFYNLPVFIFFLALLWGFDFGAKALFFGFFQALDMESTILTTKIVPLVKACPTNLLTLFKFLGFRYLVFSLRSLWICFLFVWYDRKKDILYAQSCLDLSPEQQQPL